MAKKEKEKVFTEMQFNDAQYAQDVLANSQSKLGKCKIALIIALVVQVVYRSLLTAVSTEVYV